MSMLQSGKQLSLSICIWFTHQNFSELEAFYHVPGNKCTHLLYLALPDSHKFNTNESKVLMVWVWGVFFMERRTK